ncbi:MAG: hypothetical protein Q7T21_15095 [Gallionella sp.]|nr:hypothetical protein [Gallionella sp.]
MQPLVEAAHLIAQEIERTRQHLANLEQALEGLKPLITIDAATAALPYATTSRSQPIEDISVVNADASTTRIVKRKPVAKTRAARRAKAAQVPSTGAELWLSCMGRRRRSLGELVEEALIRLELDEKSRDVITNRAGAWLYAAVKKGVLIPAGERDGHKLYKRVP